MFKFARVGLLLALLFFSFTVNAVRVSRLSLTEVRDQASSIIVATVVSKETRIGPQAKMMWTDYELEVEEGLLGVIQPGPRTLSFAGGVSGGIEVGGGTGNISLNAVEGGVTLEGADGNIALVSVDGDVTISRSSGVISVQNVDGDIILDGITSDNIEVNTVDGDLGYRGTINDDGRYFLSTHDGDIMVTVPDGTNARVSVSTFSGDLEADFPVTLSGDIDQRSFSFTLGTGKALLEISTFDGMIELTRP